MHSAYAARVHIHSVCLIPHLHDTTDRFDNRLFRVNRRPTGSQAGSTSLTTVLNEQLFVQPVVKPGCTTGLTRDLRSCEIRFDFESNFRFWIRFVVMIRFEIFESSAPSIVLCKETIGGG